VIPWSPAPRELLIDFGTPTATAVLRFPLLRGLKTFADLRTPAGGRLEILKVSRDAHSDEEGVAAFEQAIAEGDPRGRGHLVEISGGNTLEDPASALIRVNGWGGIRTHGALAGTPVFKTGALNRSATHPSN
jgi:hypothetical protein